MRTLSTALLALLTTAPIAPELMAQQPPARSQQLAQAAPRGGGKKGGSRDAAKVSAEVMVVHATEDGDYVDPKLRDLERHLQHLKYSSYRVLTDETVELSVDSSKRIDVQGDREVTLTLLSASGDKARFRVRVSNKRGNLADITVSVSKGRTFVVSGPNYQGGILLIPITARF